MAAQAAGQSHSHKYFQKSWTGIFTQEIKKKTGKHDPVCFGLCTVTNVDWHNQVQCDLDLGNSSGDLLFKNTD